MKKRKQKHLSNIKKINDISNKKKKESNIQILNGSDFSVEDCFFDKSSSQNDVTIRQLAVEVFMYSNVLPVCLPIRKVFECGEIDILNLNQEGIRNIIEKGTTGEIKWCIVLETHSGEEASFSNLMQKWRVFLDDCKPRIKFGMDSGPLNSQDIEIFIKRKKTNIKKARNDSMSYVGSYSEGSSSETLKIGESDQISKIIDLESSFSISLGKKFEEIKAQDWVAMEYKWIDYIETMNFIHRYFSNTSPLFLNVSEREEENLIALNFLPKKISNQEQRNICTQTLWSMQTNYGQNEKMVSDFVQSAHPILAKKNDSEDLMDEMRELSKQSGVHAWWSKIEMKTSSLVIISKLSSYIKLELPLFLDRDSKQWDSNYYEGRTEQKIHTQSTHIVSFMHTLNSAIRNLFTENENWFTDKRKADFLFNQVYSMQKNTLSIDRISNFVSKNLIASRKIGYHMLSVPVCPLAYPFDIYLPNEIEDFSAPGEKRGTVIEKISAYYWLDMINISWPILRGDNYVYRTYIVDDAYNEEAFLARYGKSQIFDGWCQDNNRDSDLFQKSLFEVRKRLGWSYPAGAIIPNGEKREPTLLPGKIGDYTWHPHSNPEYRKRFERNAPETIVNGSVVHRMTEKTFYMFPLVGNSHPFTETENKKGKVSILSIRINISPFLMNRCELKEENIGQCGKTWIFGLNLACNKLKNLSDSIRILRKESPRNNSSEEEEELITLENSPHSWLGHNSGSFSERKPDESFATARVERIVTPYIIEIDFIQEREKPYEETKYEFISLIFKMIMWAYNEYDIKKGEDSENSETIHSLVSAEEFLLLIDLESVELKGIKQSDLKHELAKWLDFSFTCPKSQSQWDHDSEYDDEKSHWVYSVVSRSDDGSPKIFNYVAYKNISSYLLRPMPSHKEAWLLFQRFHSNYWYTLTGKEGYGEEIQSIIQLNFKANIPYKSKLCAKPVTHGSDAVQYRGSNRSKKSNYKFSKHDAYISRQNGRPEKKENNKISFQIISLYQDFYLKSKKEPSLALEDPDYWDFFHPSTMIFKDSQFFFYESKETSHLPECKEILSLESSLPWQEESFFGGDTSLSCLESIQNQKKKSFKLVERIYMKVCEFDIMDFSNFPQVIESAVSNYETLSNKCSIRNPVSLHDWRCLNEEEKATFSQRAQCLLMRENNDNFEDFLDKIKEGYKSLKTIQKIIADKTEMFIMLKLADSISHLGNNMSMEDANNIEIILNYLELLRTQRNSENASEQSDSIQKLLNIQYQICVDHNFLECFESLDDIAIFLSKPSEYFYLDYREMATYCSVQKTPSIMWKWIFSHEHKRISGISNDDNESNLYSSMQNILMGFLNRPGEQSQNISVFETLGGMRNIVPSIYNQCIQKLWSHFYDTVFQRKKLAEIQKACSALFFNAIGKLTAEQAIYYFEPQIDSEVIQSVSPKHIISQKTINIGRELFEKSENKTGKCVKDFLRISIFKALNYSSLLFESIIEIIENQGFPHFETSNFSESPINLLDFFDFKSKSMVNFDKSIFQNIVNSSGLFKQEPYKLLVEICMTPKSTFEQLIECRNHTDTGKKITNPKKTRRKLNTAVMNPSK